MTEYRPPDHPYRRVSAGPAEEKMAAALWAIAAELYVMNEREGDTS